MLQNPRSSLLFAALCAAACASAAQAQDWRTITSMRRLGTEEALRVNVEYGAGRLTISPSTDQALYKATLRYDANVFRPLNRYQAGELDIGIEGGSIKGRNMKSGRLDLVLGSKVPLELDLKFGAVEADIELGGLNIQEAKIQTGASDTRIRVSKANPGECSTAIFEVGAAHFEASGLGNLNCEDFRLSGGVGEVTLDFSGEMRSNMNVDIDMGLGALTLRVPRGLGLSVRKSGVLASFDSQGLTKRGNVYYSESFDKADRKMVINLDAALGSIKVQWIDGINGSRN